MDLISATLLDKAGSGVACLETIYNEVCTYEQRSSDCGYQDLSMTGVQELASSVLKVACMLCKLCKLQFQTPGITRFKHFFCRFGVYAEVFGDRTPCHLRALAEAGGGGKHPSNIQRDIFRRVPLQVS